MGPSRRGVGRGSGKLDTPRQGVELSIGGDSKQKQTTTKQKLKQQTNKTEGEQK